MSEPIGTRMNLREMLTIDALKDLKVGTIFHFEKENEDTKEIEDTWIKVIRAGSRNNNFWSIIIGRYEGEIIPEPLTPEQVEQKIADELKEVKREQRNARVRANRAAAKGSK